MTPRPELLHPCASRTKVAEDVIRLFVARGDSEYGGEGVTQMEHALQAAQLAEQQGATPELIVAALLHDIGHLLHDLPDDVPDHGVDDAHEDLGAEWLRDRFPAAVLEPVRLHVASKRYLCGVNPEYMATLSVPSVVSLHLQGGPMTDAQCKAFQQQPFWQDAVRLRHWDDEAKVVGLETPPIQHFKPYLDEVILT